MPIRTSPSPLTSRSLAIIVVSVGNGPPSMELMDNVGNASFDLDNGRSVTTRLGLVSTAIADLRAEAAKADPEGRLATDLVRRLSLRSAK